MKKTLIALIVLASLNVTTQAMADDTDANGATSVDKVGFWIGAGIGNNDLSNAFSSKLEAGYDFNENVGIYTSYDYIHDLDNAELHLGTLGVKGNYYLTQNLSVFGKLGATYIFAEGYNQNIDDSFTGTAGLGLEYQLTNAVSTKIGYDYYQNLELSQSSSSDLHQIYWSMTYKFGKPATPMIVTQKVEVVKEVPVEVPVEVSKMTRSSFVLPFQTGQVTINDYGRYNLDEITETLQVTPMLTAEITGRTDSTGTTTINAKVSEARAKAVYQYLIDNGIDTSRLTVKSISDQSPLTSNSGQSLIERSVEVIIK